jgi:hypothetical protein
MNNRDSKTTHLHSTKYKLKRLTTLPIFIVGNGSTVNSLVVLAIYIVGI